MPKASYLTLISILFVSYLAAPPAFTQAKQSTEIDSITERKEIDRYLKPIAKAIKYEKRVPPGSMLSEDLTSAKISFHDFWDPDPVFPLAVLPKTTERTQTLTPEEVRRQLASYFIVTGKDWIHSYSHVGFSDETGLLELADGRKIIFLLRPGGLGAIVYPDGGTLFLARELQHGMLQYARTADQKYLQVKDGRQWKNPFIIVNANETVTLVLSQVTRQTIKTKDLAQSLIKLPTTDWPYGGVVAISDCSTRSGEDADKAVQKNHQHVMDMLRGFGVVIVPWPSG